MKSIRGYLMTRALAGSAVVLVAAGLAAYTLLASVLHRQFDANLTDRIQGFVSILFQVEDQVEFAFSGELMTEFEREDKPAYFELWFDDGLLLERSESLGGSDLVLPAEPGYEPVHWTAELPDGRRGRFAAQLLELHHVYPEEGPQRPETKRVIVALARGREQLVAAERTLLLGCALTVAACMGLLALLMRRTIGRGLEPANRMARVLADVRLSDLPERLDLGPMPVELQPMATTADELVRRVDAAFERERRTTADIAHELRTPISEVLTASEVALRNGRDREHTAQALGTIRDVAWRMGHTLSTLLKLARLEMGEEDAQLSEVDLAQMIEVHLLRVASAARARGIEFDVHTTDSARVRADAEVLTIVVSNLIGNAVHHAPGPGTVELRSEVDGADWSVQVENDAGDLTSKDLRAMAAPFWRKQRGGSKGSGLGLALSTALASQAGLELVFELRDGRLLACLGPATRVTPAASS